MNIFLMIVYIVVWTPIKYIGLGVKWLVGYPARKHKAELELEEEVRRAAQRKLQEEQRAAQRKLQEEQRVAQRKLQEEQRAAQEIQVNGEFDNYLKELEIFEQLSQMRQQQLTRMRILKFELVKKVPRRLFPVLQNWIISDPANDLKVQIIKNWCNNNLSIRTMLLNYCREIARNKESASDLTELDLQFCRMVLRLGFVSYSEIPTYESIIRKYYLGMGIIPIKCDDLLINGRLCFFKAPVRIVAQRQLNGNLYYDMDNAIDFSFYLFSDQFEVLGNCHSCYLLSNLVNIQIDSQVKSSENCFMLLITLRNCSSLNFWCDAYTAVSLLVLLPLMATNKLQVKVDYNTEKIKCNKDNN